MNKPNIFQVIALALALITGASVSGLFFSRDKNKAIKNLTEQHKLELTKEINLSKERIQILNVQLNSLNVRIKTDSVQIKNLNSDIEKHKRQVEKQRKDISKLTPSEKKKFILDRYSN